MLGFVLEGKKNPPLFPLKSPDTGELGFNSFVWINSRSSAPHPIIPRQKHSLTKVWRGEIFATCWAKGFSEDIWLPALSQCVEPGPPQGARLGWLLPKVASWGCSGGEMLPALSLIPNPSLGQGMA